MASYCGSALSALMPAFLLSCLICVTVGAAVLSPNVPSAFDGHATATRVVEGASQIGPVSSRLTLEPDNEFCTTSDACAGVCALSKLTAPQEGICIAFVDDVPECSLDYCSMEGAEAYCQWGESKVTTCEAYHAYDTETDKLKLCAFPCTRECWEKSARPVASNGQDYCTECALKTASCKSGFKIFGPITAESSPQSEAEESSEPSPEARAELPVEESVEPTAEASVEPTAEARVEPNADASPQASTEESAEPAVIGPALGSSASCTLGDISPFDVRTCCVEFKVGCLQEGDSCSTTGSMIPMAPCEDPLECVITDLGAPAVDLPDSGTCVALSAKPAVCSVELCALHGGKKPCRLPMNLDTTVTCKAWAMRTDRNPGPDCNFVCATFCIVGPKAPMGSDGKKYCSECQLQSVSCASNFDVFGPVTASS